MTVALRIPALASLVAFAVLLAVPSSAAAQNDDVANTPHNLSVSNSGTDPTGGNLVDYGEICVYCHTPHAAQADAPLWNRQFNSGGGYQMYTSATLDMSIDGQPTGVSLACLSCHDGTIGLDVITNAPNAYVAGGGTIPPTTSGTNTMPAGDKNLGEDLRNDHPISVVYDPTLDLGFNSETSILNAGLKLFTDPTSPGSKVQCASCHNPHNETNQPFLRIDNSGSTLCKTCHIK